MAGAAMAAGPAGADLRVSRKPPRRGRPRPRLGWKLQADATARGVRQTAYRILVASSPELLAKDQADPVGQRKDRIRPDFAGGVRGQAAGQPGSGASGRSRRGLPPRGLAGLGLERAGPAGESLACSRPTTGRRCGSPPPGTTSPKRNPPPSRQKLVIVQAPTRPRGREGRHRDPGRTGEGRLPGR